MPNKFHHILLFFISAAGFLPATGQSDTLAAMRRFIKICNGYKTLPVQLKVEITKSTNLVLSTADTATVRASFYLDEHGSYIAMEGVEQLANDSLVLLVNTTTKRMMVAPNHQSVATRLRQMMSMGGQDSNLLQLAGKFQALETVSTDTATINLTSRSPLLHSDLPREQIRAKYNKRTGTLTEVTAIKRSLLPVSDSVFNEAATQPEWSGKTVVVKSGRDTSYFLIKEEQTVFRYVKLDHSIATRLPAEIGDRVVCVGPGMYRPGKSYADFVLSKQY
jgi:hypothetical protein